MSDSLTHPNEMDDKTSNETSQKRVVHNETHNCDKEIIKEILNGIVQKICHKSNECTETQIELNSYKEVKKNIYFGGELVKFLPKSNQKQKSIINTEITDVGDEYVIDQNDESKTETTGTIMTSPVTKDTDAKDKHIQKWDDVIDPSNIIDEDICEVVITNIGNLYLRGNQKILPKMKKKIGKSKKRGKNVSKSNESRLPKNKGMLKSDDSIQPKNNDSVLKMKTLFMSEASNKSVSSSSSSMSSNDTFSSVSNLQIYKDTMQCEEINPKFSKLLKHANAVHNSAKLEKARDIILPILEDSELNGHYKGVFGSLIMNFIRKSICAGTKTIMKLYLILRVHFRIY